MAGPLTLVVDGHMNRNGLEAPHAKVTDRTVTDYEDRKLRRKVVDVIGEVILIRKEVVRKSSQTPFPTVVRRVQEGHRFSDTQLGPYPILSRLAISFAERVLVKWVPALRPKTFRPARVVHQ